VLRPPKALYTHIKDDCAGCDHKGFEKVSPNQFLKDIAGSEDTLGAGFSADIFWSVEYMSMQPGYLPGRHIVFNFIPQAIMGRQLL
jgi:hypothetical protein